MIVLGVTQIWLSFQAPSFSVCEASGKSSNFSVLQFPNIEDEINNSAYRKALWWEFDEIKHVKSHFRQCHVNSKLSVDVSLCLSSVIPHH